MQQTPEFLQYIRNMVDELPSKSLSTLEQQAGGWEYVYLVYIDILKGFCDQGQIASERVGEMVEPVRWLTDQLLSAGLPSSNLIFLNDAHPENSVEFQDFPPHCVRGTKEAEVVDRLQPIQQLPGTKTFSKGATQGLFGVDEQGVVFHEWLKELLQKSRPTFLLVGDCTDLCIYQNALGIKLYANQMNVDIPVIVSKEHVRTYDITVEQAHSAGIYPHDADWLDAIFLYHMAINGVEVIRDVTEA